MAFAADVGVTLDPPPGAPHAFLFGEDQARYLIATDQPEALVAEARAAGLAAGLVGQAGGASFACEGLFGIALDRLRQAHEGWMPGYMD
jgi:phosphoribosylformylglycinamidine synthase